MTRTDGWRGQSWRFYFFMSHAEGDLLMRSPTMSRIIWLMAKPNDLSRPSPCKHSTEIKLISRYAHIIRMGKVRILDLPEIAVQYHGRT